MFTHTYTCDESLLKEAEERAAKRESRGRINSLGPLSPELTQSDCAQSGWASSNGASE